MWTDPGNTSDPLLWIGEPTLVALLLLACSGPRALGGPTAQHSTHFRFIKPEPQGGPGADEWDRDGDGYFSWWLPGAYDPATSPGLDCDDADATVYPGAGC